MKKIIVAFSLMFVALSCNKNDVKSPQNRDISNTKSARVKALNLSEIPGSFKFNKLSKEQEEEFKRLLEKSTVPAKLKMVEGDISKLPSEESVKETLFEKRINNNDTEINSSRVEDEHNNDKNSFKGGQNQSSYNQSITFVGNNPTIWPDPVITVVWNTGGTNVAQGFQVTTNYNTSMYGGGINVHQSTVTTSISSQGVMTFGYEATIYTGYQTADGTILGSSQVVNYTGVVSSQGQGYVTQTPIVVP